ncbi:kinetochore-associated Ndc80 complex subunit spc25 [Tulasnella sp. 417]|nr:kinetochore-associated Ndc80 complex subunit spc25 [Tulasnella sp. 417]
MNGYQPFQLMTILQNGGGGGSGTPLDTRYSECIAVQGTFMMALQNHITKAKEEIKARKEAHTKRQEEDEERKKEMEREIEECAAKEVKMIEQVKRERAEVAELEAHVLSLEKQQANTTETFHRKEEEIEELKKDIFRRKGVLSRDKEVLETHARRTAREAKELQDALGWTIEGVQKDMLLFRFTHIDPVEPEKEFNIVLDVSSRTYRVTSSTPLLGTLPTLLEELNETRQFYVFVRRLREAFRVQAEDERRYKGGLPA